MRRLKAALQQFTGILPTVAVLCALLSLGIAALNLPLQADTLRPATRTERRREEAARLRQEMADIQRRVSEQVSTAPLSPSPAQRRREADARRADQLFKEASALAAAMTRYAKEVDHTSERILRVLDLPGLATALVAESQKRADAGLWLPLGRAKAPAFFASVIRHEVSWRWRDPNIVGANNERCGLQVHPETARMFGIDPKLLATDFSACFEAARRTLERCMQTCGELPAENYFSCYCTAGQCGAASDVVASRFTLARQLLAYMQ